MFKFFWNGLTYKSPSGTYRLIVYCLAHHAMQLGIKFEKEMNCKILLDLLLF